MGDAVATQVLRDDDDYYIAKFINLSDGSGETTVTKVDASLIHAEGLILEEIWYSSYGMITYIYWNATANQLILACQEDVTDHWDFTDIGGLPAPAVAGVNGDILFTTSGHTASDTYSIILKCRKI